MNRCDTCGSKGDCREWCGADPEVLCDELEMLREQNRILREALEWYAKWDWSDKYIPNPKRATEALAKADEVGK